MGNVLVFAQDQNRGQYGSTPDEILKNVRQQADTTKMTESRLDNVNIDNQSFGQSNRITNTLDTLRAALGPYLQWLTFIALSGAVILIIYNGFLLATSMWDDAVQKETMARIKKIATGVIIVTAAYFIIKLLVSAITYILG